LHGRNHSKHNKAVLRQFLEILERKGSSDRQGHMLDSERAEFVRRACEKAELDRYIPRRFTTASGTGEVPLEEYRFRRSHRERDPELPELLRHPRLLILAEPGGGKSVIARAAVHETARAGRVPVLVELKEYRGDLSKILRSAVPDELLQDGTVNRAYIFDGIDEVPAEWLPKFARDLDRLAETDTAASVLATARQAFYVSHRDLFAKLSAVFHLLDFADELHSPGSTTTPLSLTPSIKSICRKNWPTLLHCGS